MADAAATQEAVPLCAVFLVRVFAGVLHHGSGFLCAKACPQHLIQVVPTENTIQPQCANLDKGPKAIQGCAVSCIGCRICEKYCPCKAIKVVDNHAVICQEKCIACGMCAVKCPRGVIHDKNGILSIR